MKFQVLSRNETLHTRARRDDPLVLTRNLDPSLHPFEKEKEYVRALKAAKLERHFAKPFVGAMEGHGDTVTCMTTSQHSLVELVSGSAEGQIRVWDVAKRSTMWLARDAHAGFVRGVSMLARGEKFLSTGSDKAVKIWTLHPSSSESETRVVVHDEPILSCDAHWREDRTFATCGEDVCLWDAERLEVVNRFKWSNSEAIYAVKFNPAETSLLASVGGADRSVVLYDARLGTPLGKLTQYLRNNQLAWNPVEPMNFSTANEDGNVYTFDMRKLDRAMNVHKDHVAAVMDLHYSPTGRELVAGAYDRSVRIFSVRGDAGKSREVYTAPRMQRVFCVRFSPDARFVYSGSEDAVIRVWKARAAQPLGALSRRQADALAYNDKLLQRYSHMPEIRKIHKGRRLPKLLHKMTKERTEEAKREREKRARVAKHSDPRALRERAREEGGTLRKRAVAKVEE